MIKQAPQGFEAFLTHSKDNDEGLKKVKIVPKDMENRIRVFKQWPTPALMQTAQISQPIYALSTQGSFHYDKIRLKGQW